MKILLISSSIFPLPPQGYSGLEMLVYWLACGFQKAGHQVAVVAPEQSRLPEGIELIPIGLREQEEAYFQKYRERLGEFDIIFDHTFQSWCYTESARREPDLPIVKTFHTDPSIWGSPPPVFHPNLVGISDSHTRRLAMHLGVVVERVYNGLDTEFYTPANGRRNDKWLWLARYTPEKGCLEAAQLAKRLRVKLDMYGDADIVSSQEYVDRCRREADGLMVRWNPGVTREETVALYRQYRGLLYMPNWEGPFEMVMVEAQLCGLPVVTLDRGPMREVVSSDGGFVCRDAAEVEEVIRSGKIDTLDPVKVRQGALKFSKEAMTEGYLKLFERVVARDTW